MSKRAITGDCPYGVGRIMHSHAGAWEREKSPSSLWIIPITIEDCVIPDLIRNPERINKDVQDSQDDDSLAIKAIKAIISVPSVNSVEFCGSETRRLRRTRKKPGRTLFCPYKSRSLVIWKKARSFPPSGICRTSRESFPVRFKFTHSHARAWEREKSLRSFASLRMTISINCYTKSYIIHQAINQYIHFLSWASWISLLIIPCNFTNSKLSSAQTSSYSRLPT